MYGQASKEKRLGVRGRKDRIWRWCEHVKAGFGQETTPLPLREGCRGDYRLMRLHDGYGAIHLAAIDQSRLAPEPEGRPRGAAPFPAI